MWVKVLYWKVSSKNVEQQGQTMRTGNRTTVDAEATSSRLTALIGTLFVLLFLLGFWLVSTAPDATVGNALVKFYQSDQHRLERFAGRAIP